MAKVATDAYALLYERINKDFGLKSDIGRKAKEYNDMYGIIISILQSDSKESVKLKQIEDVLKRFGVKSINELQAPLLERASQVTRDMIARTQEVRAAEMVMPLIEYHTENFLDRVFNNINVSMLYTKYGKQTDDILFSDKTKFPTTKSREEFLQRITDAKTLLIRLKTSDGNLVLNDMSDTDFQILKKGIEAVQYLTINMNNRLKDRDKAPESEWREISKQKEFLEKFMPVLNVREQLAIPATRQSFNVVIPGFDKLRSDKKAMVKLHDAKAKKLAVLEQSRQGLTLLSNYISEMVTSLNNANSAYNSVYEASRGKLLNNLQTDIKNHNKEIQYISAKLRDVIAPDTEEGISQPYLKNQDGIVGFMARKWEAQPQWASKVHINPNTEKKIKLMHELELYTVLKSKLSKLEQIEINLDQARIKRNEIVSRQTNVEFMNEFSGASKTNVTNLIQGFSKQSDKEYNELKNSIVEQKKQLNKEFEQLTQAISATDRDLSTTRANNIVADLSSIPPAKKESVLSERSQILYDCLKADLASEKARYELLLDQIVRKEAESPSTFTDKNKKLETSYKSAIRQIDIALIQITELDNVKNIVSLERLKQALVIVKTAKLDDHENTKDIISGFSKNYDVIKDEMAKQRKHVDKNISQQLGGIHKTAGSRQDIYIKLQNSLKDLDKVIGELEARKHVVKQNDYTETVDLLDQYKTGRNELQNVLRKMEEKRQIVDIRETIKEALNNKDINLPKAARSMLETTDKELKNMQNNSVKFFPSSRKPEIEEIPDPKGKMKIK